MSFTLFPFLFYFSWDGTKEMKLFALFSFIFLVLAEKRWNLLHEFVDNSGINSRLVLFLWNRYNSEVCSSCAITPIFCSVIFLTLHIANSFSFKKSNMFISLQRRCNLAKGWMSKPVWKQVCLLIIFELFITLCL